MAILSLLDVRSIAQRKRPWTIRLECVEPATNTYKFWYATGRGTNEAVEVGHGRIGAKPQLKLTTYAKFEAKVTEKLRKGYTYENTSYIRMSKKSLDVIQANSGHTPGSGYAASAANRKKAKMASFATPAPGPALPVGTNTPAPQGQMVGSPPPTSGLVATTTTLPQHVNPSLPPPFGFIAFLKPSKGGGWDALDTNKTKLLDLPFASGKAMLRDFPAVVSILA